MLNLAGSSNGKTSSENGVFVYLDDSYKALVRCQLSLVTFASDDVLLSSIFMSEGVVSVSWSIQHTYLG